MTVFSALRAQLGFSQQQVCEFLDVSRETVNAYEEGTRIPSVQEIQAMKGFASTIQGFSPSLAEPHLNPGEPKESRGISHSPELPKKRSASGNGEISNMSRVRISTKITTKQDTNAIVALFSGAGGMSLGFNQAGFAPTIAADIDEDACQTYRTNISNDVINADLSQPIPELERVLSHIRNPLAIIGGPPCQGFSSAGLKSARDARNRLIFSYFSIVERLQPRWFLFENVEGLLTSNGGKSVAELVRQFVKMGYRTRLEKLNFAAYGLPQARKRVLLIGNRIGLDFALPQSEFSFDAGKHKCKGNLRLAPCIDEALAGLGVTSPDGQRSKYSSALPVNEYDTLMRIGNVRNDVSLHFSTVSEKMLNVIAKLAPGETMKDLPEQYWHESYKRRAFRRVMDGTPTEKRGGAPSGIKRLKGELNALTITSASPRELIHPVEHRPLTLREAARLQSFPDAFEFCGNSQSVARQIGNAFPPLVAASIARHIGKLDGTFGAGGGHKPRLPGALIGYRLTDAFGMSPALENTKTLLDFVQYEQEAFVFLQEREKVA